MSTNKKLKIGLIGCGLIGARHIEVIEGSNIAICESVLATGGTQSRDLCASKNIDYLTDEASFFKRDLDGVIIASPNGSHIEHLKLCADNNIPVLVEKPVIAAFQDISLLDDIDDNYLQKKVLPGHHRHHHPLISRIKSMIDGDELGEVVAVTAKATFYKPDSYFQEAAWRTKYGIGGVGLINLVHEIGLMEYLFGPLLKIKSLTSNFVRLNLAEETIALCMEFKSGALGTMLVSDTVVSPYSWEMSVGENPAYPNYSFDCYEIMGTNASIGFPSMQLASYPGERNWWNDMSFSVIKKDISDPFERQFNHFCDVIEKKALPLISWYSALKAVEHISSVLKRDVDD